MQVFYQRAAVGAVDAHVRSFGSLGRDAALASVLARFFLFSPESSGVRSFEPFKGLSAYTRKLWNLGWSPKTPQCQESSVIQIRVLYAGEGGHGRTVHSAMAHVVPA